MRISDSTPQIMTMISMDTLVAEIQVLLTLNECYFNLICLPLDDDDDDEEEDDEGGDDVSDEEDSDDEKFDHLYDGTSLCCIPNRDSTFPFNLESDLRQSPKP